MKDERMFPIKGERCEPKGTIPAEMGRVRRPAGQVPWGVAEEAYKVYSRRYGTSQSLEHLADRGGFGWSELVMLLQDRDDDAYECLPAGLLKPKGGGN